jgi:glucans biosynthesis protein
MNRTVEIRLAFLRGARCCLARNRAGAPCQAPALRGRRRCRLHGGWSTGAPRGPGNGNYGTGDWTAEAMGERRWLRSLVRSFGKVEGAP